jgi:hypothetical protein
MTLLILLEQYSCRLEYSKTIFGVLEKLAFDGLDPYYDELMKPSTSLHTSSIINHHSYLSNSIGQGPRMNELPRY